jgi:hypothetical protein
MNFGLIFGVCYALAAVVLLGSMVALNGFLGSTREIRDQASLNRFKSLARVQMYLALLVVVLMGTGLLAGLKLTSERGMSGLGVVILANLVTLGLGVYHKKIEARVRGLPSSPDAVAEEYRRVSETWVKKALPDF